MSRTSVPFSRIVLTASIVFFGFVPVAASARTSRSLTTPPLAAQSVTDGTWDVLPPFHREAPAMVYDPLRDRMLEFGGFVENGDFTEARNQVWALSLGASQAWTLVATTGEPPPPVDGPGVIYDPVGDQLVVWGGVSNVDGSAPTDVWTLSLTGTPTWTRVTPSGGPPEARDGFGTAYDPVRGRMLVFDGRGTVSPAMLNDVWALQLGASPSWTQLAPTGTPPAGREACTMVYDSTIDGLVIFGGYSLTHFKPGDPPNTTWNDAWTLSLSGTPAWTPLAPSGTPPSPRLNASSIYDPLGDRILMFAGAPIGARGLNDLWSLTLGVTPAWTQLSPASPPSGRRGAATAFDPIRQQMVSFGGSLSGAPGFWGNDDLVMLDLNGPLAWTASTLPSLRPDGKWYGSAIVDPLAGRMLVFGGRTDASGNTSNIVWQLPLAGPPVWSPLAVAGTPPPGHMNHSAIFDPVRSQMIVFGGIAAEVPGTPLNDLWTLSLTGTPTWTQLTPLGTPPPARQGHTAIYDPVGDRMIVFGGAVGLPPGSVNDLWSLSLSGTPTWSPLAASGTPPSARSFHSAIYDQPNGRIVIFGGSGPLNDTWALTLGASPAWSQLSPTGTPPSPREGHTAVVDDQRDRMLVFSGADNSFNFERNDVWELTLGASPAWTQLAPAGTWPPAGREGACAIYDHSLDRLLAFGGYNATDTFGAHGQRVGAELRRPGRGGRPNTESSRSAPAARRSHAVLDYHALEFFAPDVGARTTRAVRRHGPASGHARQRHDVGGNAQRALGAQVRATGVVPRPARVGWSSDYPAPAVHEVVRRSPRADP